MNCPECGQAWDADAIEDDAVYMTVRVLGDTLRAKIDVSLDD